jgi:hypothetical protein
VAEISPGNWHVTKFNDIKSFWVVAGDRTVARQIKNEADAHAIAAVPDLLAACEAARLYGNQGQTPEGLDVGNMLREAIAKARKAVVRG